MAAPADQCWIVVDVEADGPCPGLFSMVNFGAVLLDDHDEVFFGETAPLPGASWAPEALAISGVSRADHERYPDPGVAMVAFERWIERVAARRRPVFWSDNVGFDWQFVNYYFHRYLGRNPFGHGGRRIADLAAGMKVKGWTRLRLTRHTHHPVDDARGNAEALEALLQMQAQN